LPMRSGTLSGIQPPRSGRRRRRQMDCRSSQAHEPKGEAMRGNLLVVLLLLLATGVAQTDKKPDADHAAGADKTSVKTKAVTGQKKEVQSKTKAVQPDTAKAQAKAKAAPEA